MDRSSWISFDRARTVDWADEVSWLQQVVLAGCVALVLSLAGDWIAVNVARHLFTIPHAYEPFTIARYGLFTFVGVAGATAAWPVVNWLSPRPRELYGALAIAVTAVLL